MGGVALRGNPMFYKTALLSAVSLSFLSPVWAQNTSDETVMDTVIVEGSRLNQTATEVGSLSFAVLLGPSAYVILDRFGGEGYIAWALIYPALLGLVTAAFGYLAFRKSDLV